MSPLGVHSEVGRLRRVVLHRPGLELERLTPSTVHDLLFEDVLWAERAREEHDAFAALLREHGVVVDHFSTLLAEALDVPEARGFLADRLATAPRPRGRPRRLARPAAHRRPAEAGPAGTRDQQPALGEPGAGGLPAVAAAEPPLPAGQRGVGVLGLLREPDGDAGPPPRG